MKLAVPDMISNSYFPAIAAIELGCFKQEGLDISLELIYPVDKCYAALRDGTVDFVGGSAHSALSAFPRWHGAKLLCAQGQGMYWFLVMHKDFGGKRGDLSVVKGRSIGAAPWVDMGLRRLLIEAGIDLSRDQVKIAPVPGAQGAGVNFGVTAAKALEERKIDGFWANGMGTEVAVRRGVGTVVLLARRRICRRPRHGEDPGRVEGECRARDRGGPQAFSAVRSRADRRAHPPGPSLLRRVDLEELRRRHEPILARRRHTLGRRSLRGHRGDAIFAFVESRVTQRTACAAPFGQSGASGGRLSAASTSALARAKSKLRYTFCFTTNEAPP